MPPSLYRQPALPIVPFQFIETLSFLPFTEHLVCFKVYPAPQVPLTYTLTHWVVQFSSFLYYTSFLVCFPHWNWSYPFKSLLELHGNLPLAFQLIKRQSFHKIDEPCVTSLTSSPMTLGFPPGFLSSSHTDTSRCSLNMAYTLPQQSLCTCCFSDETNIYVWLTLIPSSGLNCYLFSDAFLATRTA